MFYFVLKLNLSFIPCYIYILKDFGIVLHFQPGSNSFIPNFIIRSKYAIYFLSKLNSKMAWGLVVFLLWLATFCFKPESRLDKKFYFYLSTLNISSCIKRELIHHLLKHNHRIQLSLQSSHRFGHYCVKNFLTTGDWEIF